jgi:hypothetical protein
MQYGHKGRLYRESTGETDERKALRKLRDKLAEIRLNRIGKVDFVPNCRLRVEDLLDALEADFRLRQVASLPSVRSRLKPLKDALGTIRAQQLTSEAVDHYIEFRLADREIHGKQVKGNAKATANRETQLLGQAFALAIAREKLRSAPQIRYLFERGNERRGFFEQYQFDRLIQSLPQYLKGFANFGFLSGWRKAEIASLMWQDVDMLGACEPRMLRTAPAGYWHLRASFGRSSSDSGKCGSTTFPMRLLVSLSMSSTETVYQSGIFAGRGRARIRRLRLKGSYFMIYAGPPFAT